MSVRPIVALGLAIVGGAAVALLVAAEASAPAPGPAAALAARHPVTVRHPSQSPRVISGAIGHDGKAATIACGTCHATRPPNPANAASADLNLFHQGLAVAHGTNTCLSCHNPGDYDSLRLADGRKLAFTDAMTLCAQCHGPQYRDWQHGAHGGMSGYWDTTRGGRLRQSCTGCHDPHTPKYQGALPAPPPRDRFQTAGGHP